MEVRYSKWADKVCNIFAGYPGKGLQPVMFSSAPSVLSLCARKSRSRSATEPVVNLEVLVRKICISEAVLSCCRALGGEQS